MEYKTCKRDELIPFAIRDIRPDVVERLKERIKNGYNPARPLAVIPQDGTGKYLVADGNHRLAALDELGIKEDIPVLIRKGDAFKLAVEANQDEDVYAKMDVFDWVGIIGKLEGTQAEISNRVGLSREQVAYYQAIPKNVVTPVWEMARACQEGRVTKNVTRVTFDFSEGWFRTSGLYDLKPRYQRILMESFMSDKFNWRKEKVQTESKKYKLWQDFIAIGRQELYNSHDKAKLAKLIENGTFKSEEQLRTKIKDLNAIAKNKLICGDASQELEKLDDASIDLVITDPPYGIDYSSDYSIYKDYVTKSTICGDSGPDKAAALLDTTLEVLARKTKPDAHIYIFTSWKVYCPMVAVIQKYFKVKNMVVWDKGNCSMGDLEDSWGNQHELIIFATKGRKGLKRRADILAVPRVPTTKAIHPTQKPVELIKQILSVSATPADTVCDPFMGSGSTIKAIKEHGDLNYVGIEIDRTMFDKAKAYLSG